MSQVSEETLRDLHEMAGTVAVKGPLLRQIIDELLRLRTAPSPDAMREAHKAGPVHVDDKGNIFRSTRDVLFAPTSLTPQPAPSAAVESDTERDAARYQWLRKGGYPLCEIDDAAIDAAIKAAKSETT